MAKNYDIKWKNDLKMYMNTFKSFIMEGNINDLQPVEDCEGYDYVSLENAIAEMYGDDYCVVFYDHTKLAGEPIEETDDDDDNADEATEEQATSIDETRFNSFTFYRKNIFSKTGERIVSPNIELFAEYYKKDYLSSLEGTDKRDMQSGNSIDIHRIFDVMNEFDEKKKDPKYEEAKPFMFILPDVSRYMTTPGLPAANENALLMMLFNATLIEKTSCKLMLFVDKNNDLPTWFESENNNSAVKKIYIPTPDSKFRETFFLLELKDVMDPIKELDLPSKAVKFASYTENYSLRRLRQLKEFIVKESDSVNDDVPSYKKIENIDKTVLRFDLGENKDPWRDSELMERITAMAGEVTKEIKGQNAAIVNVIKTLRTASTGVKSSKKNDRRPRAIFFFAGPTGVGKTELTKQIAENIFQKQDSMIRFDMSEFRQEHSDARLFGAPPGYVGYDAGGELTRAVKQNPFSIILFDEIEKATPKIWDKFLQILGDGRLTDGKGETVFFTQSIIVFTSNLGITADPIETDLAKIRRDAAIGELLENIQQLEDKIDASEDATERKKLVGELYALYFNKARLQGLTCDIRNEYIFTNCYQDLGAQDAVGAFNQFVTISVRERIQDYFNNIGRREVLGRIGDDNILVFNFIDADTAVSIAKNTRDKFIKYLKEEHDSQLDLEISESAWNKVINEVQKSDVLNLGGRGIVTCVEKLISDPVGEFLADPKHFMKKGLLAIMDCKNGELIVDLR